ncbi:MAG: aminoglycoside phosphotransferase family protein [Actinomycetota bacterium]
MIRPYVDRPLADPAAAARAAAHAAAHWQLPAPSPLRIGMNAIHRCGDVVLRVSSPTAPASVSIELAEVLGAAGVATLEAARAEVVELDGMSVTAWPFAASPADDGDVDWPKVGRMVRLVHELDPARLPESLPLPSPVGFAWWDFDRLLDDVADQLDDAARAGIDGALARHRGWDTFTDADTVVCHGDVHPGNVLIGEDGPILIDWDLLCRAPAGWDHGPLMTWTERWGGAPGVYESFASGYGRSLVGDRWAEAFAELRLVAATLMRVAASARDDHARPEADRRLAWWRGDPDAPTWRAV